MYHLIAFCLCVQPGHFCQGYAPIVDGPGGFIPKQPLEMRRELPADQVVPSMGGICSDDGSLYAFICELQVSKYIHFQDCGNV